ncbi:MAG TPA: Dabb family protein [Pedobacter sp.]|nr:Dabb family protein [Pedobacter sp.]
MTTKFSSGVICLALAMCLTLFSSSKPTAFKQLRHVVAFSYKPEVTNEQKAKVNAWFLRLKSEIPEIQNLEGGTDIKPAGKKFSQCFIVTVKSEEDLNTYGSHPKHKAFSAFVDPLLAEVMVLDYWSEQ